MLLTKNTTDFARWSSKSGGDYNTLQRRRRYQYGPRIGKRRILPRWLFGAQSRPEGFVAADGGFLVWFHDTLDVYFIPQGKVSCNTYLL